MQVASVAQQVSIQRVTAMPLFVIQLQTAILQNMCYCLSVFDRNEARPFSMNHHPCGWIYTVNNLMHKACFLDRLYFCKSTEKIHSQRKKSRTAVWSVNKLTWGWFNVLTKTSNHHPHLKLVTWQFCAKVCSNCELEGIFLV